MRPNLQATANLVTVTEEILNGKLYVLCSGVFHQYIDGRRGSIKIRKFTIMKNQSIIVQVNAKFSKFHLPLLSIFLFVLLLLLLLFWRRGDIFLDKNSVKDNCAS